MTPVLKPFALAALLAFAAGAAQAADGASVCRGAAPADVAELHGPVLHVPDADRLCVALSPDPSDWVPLRLADAPNGLETGRGALMAASFGQDATCRVVGRDADGLLAICRTADGPVGARLATPQIIRAGQTWR
ncbi:MAG: hypothetical protein U1C74_33880 [Phenylobacterium sp.]|nr:hypothetical protein [Phenylobacterium sp.]